MSSARTELFIRRYRKAIEDATHVVAARDATGRNEAVPLDEMFAEGPDTIAALLWMKVGRLRGNLAVGRLDLAREELADILNYSAFGIVLVDDKANRIDPEQELC